MPHADSECVDYLERAGFHYKPAESPDLWTHLASRFAPAGNPVGPKFAPITGSSMEELIARGERTLLQALVDLHRRSGALGRVAPVIELPFIVGIAAAMPLAKAGRDKVLRLIERPGTPRECVIHALPAAADDIGCTNRMTASGGLYADGHTAGYFDLRPGPEAATNDVAWLATWDEIASLAGEMEAKIEDITIVTRAECERMIEKARRTQR